MIFFSSNIFTELWPSLSIVLVNDGISAFLDDVVVLVEQLVGGGRLIGIGADTEVPLIQFFY